MFSVNNTRKSYTYKLIVGILLLFYLYYHDRLSNHICWKNIEDFLLIVFRLNYFNNITLFHLIGFIYSECWEKFLSI